MCNLESASLHVCDVEVPHLPSTREHLANQVECNNRPKPCAVHSKS